MYINTLNRLKTGDPRLIGLSQRNTTDSGPGSPTIVTLRGFDGGTDEPKNIYIILTYSIGAFQLSLLRTTTVEETKCLVLFLTMKNIWLVYILVDNNNNNNNNNNNKIIIIIKSFQQRVKSNTIH